MIRTCLFLVFLFVVINHAQRPTPPTTFPPQFFSWVMTSVTRTNQSQPVYVWGQQIVYDSVNKYASRFNEQDLVNPSQHRPNDYCDFNLGYHYHLNDTSEFAGTNPDCAGITKIDFVPIVWPPEFTQIATYLGTDPVNDMYCDHFYARPVVVDGQPYQIDIWTSLIDQYPCQISVQDIQSQGPITITTWSFNGFKNTIPASAVVGTVAKIQCTQKDWLCNASRNSTNTLLQQSLNWICTGYIDCSPIRPGGSHYLPNTLLNHCDWAFNAYFQTFKVLQGYSACDFSGASVLVPPRSPMALSQVADLPEPPLFTRDFVCPRKRV